MDRQPDEIRSDVATVYAERVARPAADGGERARKQR